MRVWFIRCFHNIIEHRRQVYTQDADLLKPSEMGNSSGNLVEVFVKFPKDEKWLLLFTSFFWNSKVKLVNSSKYRRSCQSFHLATESRIEILGGLPPQHPASDPEEFWRKSCCQCKAGKYHSSCSTLTGLLS